jgi:uncharacterized phage-associated protein
VLPCADIRKCLGFKTPFLATLKELGKDVQIRLSRERIGRSIGHLGLQKLLYFAHGLYLVERKEPLVTGYFEAWPRGPVHPAVYQAFKSAGAKRIDFRAKRQDLVTGEWVALDTPITREVRAHIARIIAQYGELPPDLLVSISHAKGGPWDSMVDKQRTVVLYGKRISDDLISARFKHHKISVTGLFAFGDDPLEDTPPS